GAIASTVEEIHTFAPGFDVLVVDDGSTDDTAVRAESAGASVVRLPFNLGIGGAVQTGYVYAQEHGYEVPVQIEADGQHDPRYIDDLLRCRQAAPGLNMVTGSRFMDADDAGDRSTASRRAGITVFARLVSMITRRRVTDPTSGLRMTNRT